MSCITNEGLIRLKNDDTFKSWIQKLKDSYPDKSDDEIEDRLISFINLNNGNFPGYTPFGDESDTFQKLTKRVYNGDEVRALEIYQHLFSKEFIEEFGDWCGVTDISSFSEEQLNKHNEDNQAKLSKAVRNRLGEPELLFVNSVKHKAADASVGATNDPDQNLQFKITVENGEAHADVGYNRPVQSGSITFAIEKHSVRPISSDNVYIDVQDIDKTYDFESENKGFSDKRLSAFITQSSKDLYYISSRIAKINGLLKLEKINSREDAIKFIRKCQYNLVFDTDENSPFGCIQVMPVSIGGDTIWQILSPEGIFCGNNRFSTRSNSHADKIAHSFFIQSQNLGHIKDYIISNIGGVVKSDSYLSSPIVDYENHQYVLKPSTNRTQHNIKTELGLAYALYMKENAGDRYIKYLNFAKQFPEIRQNSVGTGEIKDINMVGNLIGSILSGQLIDDNYYTAHSFDYSAIEQAIFVSRHQVAIKELVKGLWKDVARDIKSNNMAFLRDGIIKLSDVYEKIDFSDVADSISRNRVISKITDDDFRHSFCDSIDKVKAAYTYRKNDSGNKKMYDATEYTKLVSSCAQLNMLNKQIKQYLINQDGSSDTVSGEDVERLINQYFQCIETIVSIMDDDILKIEDFIQHTPPKYTPEYYSQLLYIDRSIIKMYTNNDNKIIIEKMFKLDSESSDLLQKTLHDVFSQRQITTFENLRNRFYDNYTRLNNKKKINGEQSSLQEIIDTMIQDAISHTIDEWCNQNLKCYTEAEEREYREKLKLDLEGHVKAGMPLDTFIGGSASSGHSIVNVLYSIIQTQQHRSDLLIKQKGDELLKLFKDTFGSTSPFNQCAQFCEIVEDKNNKKWVTRKQRKTTSGYFIRNVNYGQYYRAKVTEQRRILKQIPNNSSGVPYYTIDEQKSTATKLVIEWGVGSEQYRLDFLNKMDAWIDKNANRRYTSQYYIKRREILGKERNGIVVGDEAERRQNTLHRQIDGIKNRYRDKKSGVFMPFKVPPVQKKILESLEQQLADLSSPYERYVDSSGNSGIRMKSGLDLAIALNIQEWNKFIQDKRNYSQDVERYNKVEKDLKSRIGKDITQDDYDAFVTYYHRVQAKQEYYDALQKRYDGMYGDRQKDIDDIRLRRRSILSRVKRGQKGIYQFPDLDELTDAEWEELTNLDVTENKIKDEFQDQFNNLGSITASYPIPGKTPGKTFIEEHEEAGKLHTYIDSDGNEYELSVYHASRPADNDLIETVLTGEFSIEASEYMNPNFDPSNSSYEQPKEYDDKGNKLYRNDKYYEIKKNTKLFKLYETFLEYMKEANEMFGYAAISSNYKLPQIYEREASVYIGRGCSVANTFVYKMKRSYLIDERDFDRSYTSDLHADNTTSGKLRKRFVEMLSDPEHISTDLVYSVMAYYMTACRYSDKQNIQAQCELINRKIQSLEEKSHKTLRTQADNTVDTFLFENTMSAGNSGVAVAERFMEHTTAVMLKWKLKTAIKAFIDGYRLLTNVLLSNKWNARGHFWTATTRAIKQTFPSIWSTIDTLDYSLSEALMSLNNLNIQSFQDANKTKFTRAYLKSGLMPALTAVDHITTKSILLTVYDSIRVYDNGDGTKSFYNIDEYVTQYIRKEKKNRPQVSNKLLKKEAEKLYWKSSTLYDAYQLGKRDADGKVIEGTENILSIKDEYANMFSTDKQKNADAWALLQGKVQGQIDEMAAAINGYKPNDTKSSNAMKKWYLKAIFQARSFLISNYNELFKHSDVMKSLAAEHSDNKTTEALNKFWSGDTRFLKKFHLNKIVQFLGEISSEREMYNVLTSTKDVGYYFGVLSYFRKLLDNVIIYAGSKYNKQNPDYRNITKAEKVSVINAFIIMGQGFLFYNAAIYIAGLISCLLGQGSSPDDEDEWFIHWVLWLAYDIAGSMFNDTFVSLPTGDTIVDLFRGILAMVPAAQQFKQSALDSDESLTFVSAMLSGENEMFEDYEYGTNEDPFNLIKSGKWQGEMYGKRKLYEAMQNAPWLIAPWYLMPEAWVVSQYLPPIPLANLKESFSAYAARAKASYTFNNLSPVDYMRLGTPSKTDESYEKFHDYTFNSSGAMMLNSLLNTFGVEEEDVLDFIRELQQNEYSPIPSISPVDKVERMVPLGREYED